MEKEAKFTYEAPSAVVHYVRTEGIVCQSGLRNPYEPVTW